MAVGEGEELWATLLGESALSAPLEKVARTLNGSEE